MALRLFVLAPVLQPVKRLSKKHLLPWPVCRYRELSYRWTGISRQQRITRPIVQMVALARSFDESVYLPPIGLQGKIRSPEMFLIDWKQGRKVLTDEAHIGRTRARFEKERLSGKEACLRHRRTRRHGIQRLRVIRDSRQKR